MKKIMFNDQFGLTQAVLDGRKTMTRRICSIQPPYEHSVIAFPVFAGDGEDSPLWLAYRWINKDTPNEYTEWIKPQYKKEGEIIAIAQAYKDILDYLPDGFRRKSDGYISSIITTSEGYNNKMFVRADLMPHQVVLTNVRIQRLQNISDEDCLKEGIYKLCSANGNGGIAYSFLGASSNKHIGLYPSPREAFAVLIDKISGKGIWARNPWVWVYEFELVK